jgi:hypothetical protein
MGLDQYGFTRQGKLSNEESTENPVEIAYWRKHSSLQGFMENLWRERNPDNTDDFNVEVLVLTLDDLEYLEFCVIHRVLPETKGYFFGSVDRSDDYRDQDMDFITDARNAIANGLEVFYYPHW